MQPITGVQAEKFPVQAYWPDKKQTWNRCAVYYTPQGLVIYKNRPQDGDSPDFQSPIDYDRTQQPVKFVAQIGYDVFTDDGLVIITPTGGCGCGSRLRGYRPTWANNHVPWGAAHVTV